MIGRTIGHYKILEKLGEGGMGVVYKAEDTTLDRFVALKFLPAELAPSEADKARFVQEAKIASALNHPNVCTIHAIEEHEGRQFIVMEYVAGETLRKKIRVSPLDPGEAVRIATQIGAALDQAHARGIVHRDVKPENIMVTSENHVKVMDFGLAKLKGSLRLTKTSSTVGTISYMAPEQIQGGEADSRSDIFSLGVVLFEMLTGTLPFRGEHEAAMMYSIVNEESDTILKHRKDIPPEIESVVQRSLEKNPDDRYQQVNDMTEDLQKATSHRSSASVEESSTASGAQRSRKSRPVTTARSKASRVRFLAMAIVVGALVCIAAYRFLVSHATGENSLAVLPFSSGDTSTAYLSDGVTASLINRLSEFRDMKVMSRYSVARFKDGTDPRAAGQQLDVAKVLTGQLDVRGEKVVVDVVLIDVSDGSQIWGDRFEREQKNVLTIERDIVGRISEKLSVKLSGQVPGGVAVEDNLDPVAYDLYLRGRYIMLGTTDDGPSRAQEFFRQAIEREPRLAVAYAGLGESYVTQAWLGSKDRDDMLPLAKAALRKALGLDPGLSETYVLAGDVAQYFDYDWAAAETSYKKGIEVNPGNDVAHREYGNFLLMMGRGEEAIAEARKAQSLDPLSVYATHQVGFTLLATGHLSEAAVEFRKAIALNPNWVWGNIKLGKSLAHMGDTVQALAAMNRADELLAGKPGSPLAQDWLAQIAYLCGQPRRIRETLSRLQARAKDSYIDPIAIADIYHCIGDYDQMFEYLERGIEVRSTGMVFLLLEGQYLWKDVASDPRYLKLLKRLKFPEIPA